MTMDRLRCSIEPRRTDWLPGAFLGLALLMPVVAFVAAYLTPELLPPAANATLPQSRSSGTYDTTPGPITTPGTLFSLSWGDPNLIVTGDIMSADDFSVTPPADDLVLHPGDTLTIYPGITYRCELAP